METGTERFYNLDFVKFVGSILIVIYHSGHTMHGDCELFAPGAWVYVEFFAIVTGYFTIRHFQNRGGV